MRIVQYISCTLLLAALISSCIKDESIGAVNPVSKIEMTGTIDSLYSLERWDTLRIAAPEVKQTNADKPLSYSWEINFKEVSKEKNLKYVCSTYGKFTGRLKITNDDGFFYKPFELEVRYSYGKGLYMLASHNNQTIISYYADEIEGKKPELDIFAKNNPEIKLGAEPKAMYITNASDSGIYVSTGNPATLYRINANLMTLKAKIDTEPFITHISDDGIGNTAVTILLLMNKRLAQIKYNQNFITNASQQSLEEYYGKVQLFNKFYHWRNADGRYVNGQLFFDELASKLLFYSKEHPQTGGFGVLFAGKFSGMHVIDFCQASNQQEFAGVFRKKTSGEIKFFWFNPGYYDQYYPAKRIQPEIKHEGIIPAESGMNENSVIVSSATRNIMYYSSGNKLYGYSILSKGNFPTTPLFTCGESGETISAMLVSRDDAKLYVATNAASGTYKGSIYCYDLNKNSLLWEKRNITGEIKQLDYRYN